MHKVGSRASPVPLNLPHGAVVQTVIQSVSAYSECSGVRGSKFSNIWSDRPPRMAPGAIFVSRLGGYTHYVCYYAV